MDLSAEASDLSENEKECQKHKAIIQAVNPTSCKASGRKGKAKRTELSLRQGAKFKGWDRLAGSNVLGYWNK